MTSSSLTVPEDSFMVAKPTRSWCSVDGCKTKLKEAEIEEHICQYCRIERELKIKDERKQI
jgi:hypothetical protein